MLGLAGDQEVSEEPRQGLLTRPLAVIVALVVLLGSATFVAVLLLRARARAAEEATRTAFLSRAASLGYDTIVFGVRYNQTGLGCMDLRTGQARQRVLASNPGWRGRYPSVSPDGRTVAFYAEGGLEVVGPTARGKARFEPEGGYVSARPPAWSREGDRLAVWIWRDSDPGARTPEGHEPMLWIVRPRTGESRLLATTGVPLPQDTSPKLYWRSDGESLYVSRYSRSDQEFRTWEVDAETGQALGTLPFIIRAVGGAGQQLVSDAQGLWLVEPGGARIPLAVPETAYRYTFLRDSDYVVYVADCGFKSSAFFVLDTRSGVRAKVTDFGIALPGGFDLGRTEVGRPDQAGSFRKSGGIWNSGDIMRNPWLGASHGIPVVARTWRKLDWGTVVAVVGGGSAGADGLAPRRCGG